MFGGIVSIRKPCFLVALFLVIALIAMPLVSAQDNYNLSENMQECFSSNFELKIGKFIFSFNFSENNEMPSLKYLICKYKEGLNGS